MTIEEEIKERGKKAGPEMTEADFYETLNNESWKVKGEKKMKNTIEHVGYSIESAMFDAEQLRSLDDMVTHSINQHIERNSGLYTDKEVALLVHGWRRAKWIDACAASEGHICFVTKAEGETCTQN